MSEQDSPEATTKRRGRQVHTQNGTQPPTLPRPMNDDKDAWRTYWEAQGQEWTHEKRLQQQRYWIAIRANRQLANKLREQGLNEYARMFAYQAQILRRRVLWLQAVQPEAKLRWRIQKLGAYFLSLFFDLLAAYGYSPLRSAVAYVFIIVSFSIIYFALGSNMPRPYHLQWYEALVVSLTAFHGRGFFSNQFTPGDPQSFVAAAEAVIGLLIEISFIATFTQRFFDK